MPIEVKILLGSAVALLTLWLAYRLVRRRASEPIAQPDPEPDVPVGQYFQGPMALEKYEQYGRGGELKILMVFQTRGRPDEGIILPVTPIADMPGGEMPFTLQQTLRLAWYVRLFSPHGKNDKRAMQKIAREANIALSGLKMSMIEREEHLGGLPLEYKKRLNLACVCFGKEGACALFCDGLHPLLRKMVRDFVFPPPPPKPPRPEGVGASYKLAGEKDDPNDKD